MGLPSAPLHVVAKVHPPLPQTCQTRRKVNPNQGLFLHWSNSCLINYYCRTLYCNCVRRQSDHSVVKVQRFLGQLSYCKNRISEVLRGTFWFREIGLPSFNFQTTSFPLHFAVICARCASSPNGYGYRYCPVALFVEMSGCRAGGGFVEAEAVESDINEWQGSVVEITNYGQFLISLKRAYKPPHLIESVRTLPVRVWSTSSDMDHLFSPRPRTAPENPGRIRYRPVSLQTFSMLSDNYFMFRKHFIASTARFRSFISYSWWHFAKVT